MRKYGIEAPIPINILTIARRIRRWCIRANGGKSDGMCSVASMFLCEELEKAGYLSELHLT